MSGITEDLRRKIDSAGDLRSVVRSMKALAAASIGQYEKAVLSLNDYARTVELGLSVCLRQSGAAAFAPLRNPAEGGPIAAIVFGSDQGLVGRFNEVMVEFVSRTLEALPSKPTRIWAVGERIQALLTDTNSARVRLLSAPTSVNAITPLVGQIIIEIEAARENGEIEEVYLFHHQPKAGAGYEPMVRRLLPFDRAWKTKQSALPWPTKNLPEAIGSTTSTLEAFVRGYLFVLLFQACAESLASENASRLAAMERAEKNIEDVLEQLNRTFHRLRQESIDEELFDVISGYEALLPSK